jgi:MFS family permease
MARPAASTETSAATDPRGAYPWYIGGIGTWFAALGMQGVIFSWLVVGELRAEARWVGVAQSASMIPNVLLILLGGAVADRVDRRRLLIWLHLGAVLLSAGLLLVVWSGSLSLFLLILFALGMGTITAFVLPARDSLLSEVVAGRDMLRAVTGMTLTQWSAQALGALVAGSARWIGILPAIGLQGSALLAGVPTLRRLPPAPPRGGTQRRDPHVRDLAVGVREVWHSPDLLPLVALVAAVGVLFIGPFMVVFPLLIRDFYGGDELLFGLVQAAFPVGTITGSVAILLLGEIRRKGAAQLVSLLCGALCLGTISLGLPFVATLIAIAVWGMGASVFMNAGRTVFQERATESNRARVLSVYSLGFMGSAGLVGAPLSGALVEWVGPLTTCLIDACAMLVVVALATLFTNAPRIE